MLTETAIKKLQPRDSRYMVSDGQNLYIEVMVSGAKKWRYCLADHGKFTWLSLGEYPLISLLKARVERDRIRLAHYEGENIRKKQGGESLEAIAREWHKKNCEPKSERYAHKIMAIFENHIFKHIGHYPIDELTAPDILAVLF
ncbi:hypothetical protein FACS1894204_12820 [Synergistales bacterium]|nr:hypothetical protein FACS1894204_12820 [Synergistales bacterium]